MENTFSIEKPWIKEREAAICMWKFDYVRGYAQDMTVSLLNDFMCLSARQLELYAKMIKTCGFTGIQVTDICAAWRASGSWENVHDKFKILSECCHKIGLNFTVWCWAAEFSGHGYKDPEVCYKSKDPSVPPYLDGDVLACFNKYYDIYADLAPFCDRVIAHFFDPGNLTDNESIIFFLKLLASKFRDKNPSVKIAVDTWGCPEGYPEALIGAGLKDVTLMELPFLPVWKAPGKRREFREGVKKLGLELGSWGWYTADMETDQLPLMTVNSRVLKDVFNRTREQADGVMTPSYWSEMDAYHILNFFSLYCAGHLLIDPTSDPDRLLAESVRAIAGSDTDACEKLLYALELIRDARSGDTWESYWWTEPEYVLRNYDAENILSRTGIAIKYLESLAKEPEPADGIPFPVSRAQLYKLMLPHLHQIRRYALFYKQYELLKKMKSLEAPPILLRAQLEKLNFDIPAFNTATGLFGQTEAFIARRLTEEFCRGNGLDMPSYDPAVKFTFKRRIVDRMTVAQRGSGIRMWFSPDFYEGGIPGLEFIASLMEELTEENVLEKNEEGLFSLAFWEDLSFDISC